MSRRNPNHPQGKRIKDKGKSEILERSVSLAICRLDPRLYCKKEMRMVCSMGKNMKMKHCAHTFPLYINKSRKRRPSKI